MLSRKQLSDKINSNMRVCILYILLITSCQDHEEVVVDDIASTILLEATQLRPFGYFIPPPILLHPDCDSLISMPIDRSKDCYAVYHENDGDLKDYYVKALLIKIKENPDHHIEVVNPNRGIDIHNLSEKVNLPLEYSDHRSHLQEYQPYLYGWRGIFVFSQLYEVQTTEDQYFVMSLQYFCGKLCAAERVFFLKLINGNIEIIDQFQLYPNVVH